MVLQAYISRVNKRDIQIMDFQKRSGRPNQRSGMFGLDSLKFSTRCLDTIDSIALLVSLSTPRNLYLFLGVNAISKLYLRGLQWRVSGTALNL